MKRFQLVLGLSLLALPLLVFDTNSRAVQPKRPNVLMIVVDDLNDWVGFLDGNPQTITPNLDRLASRGAKFTRAYCTAPFCNPSRASVMTGLRPFTTGVYNNRNDWRRVVSADLPLTATFRRAGYFVAGAGKVYHGGFPRRSEWDDYLAPVGKDPKPTGDTGVGRLEFAPLDCRDEDLAEWKIVDYGIKQLQKPRAQPVFLAIGLYKPHMPWNVPRKYFDLHPVDEIILPDAPSDDLDDIPPAGIKLARPEGDHASIIESERWKEAVQAYLAAISYADGQIGRLLDALDDSPEGKNTIIVLWGDHGLHLGEKQHWRKSTLWEEATRAPLIWVVPGVTEPGTESERAVDFQSIYPTLTDVAGIPTPKHVEGKSLRPLLRNPQMAWSDPAVTTFGYENHAVRTDGWRYIRYSNGDEELYDETADPNEWTNLAPRPEYADQKAELAAFLPERNSDEVTNRERAGETTVWRRGASMLARLFRSK